jgi:hypothetical protein
MKSNSQVARFKSKDLVGMWVDVEGLGPGKVASFSKTSLSLLFDSMHTIEFYAQGLGTRKVLLRRRKHLRWNHGARFTVLQREPEMSAVDAALADDKASGAAQPVSWLPDTTVEEGVNEKEEAPIPAKAAAYLSPPALP